MARLLFSVLLSFSLTSAAAAAPTPKAPKPAPAKAATTPKVDLERWKRALEAGTESELLSVLTEINAQAADAKAAAPLIDQLLVRGANANVLVAALETQGRLGVATSSDAIAPYVAHRKPEIRQAAARALSGTGGLSAINTLRRALSSPDALVRAAAAQGLGTLGATDAVEDLFSVLAHDTPEAAISIAQLCAPDQCDRLMALVGKLKFEVLEASFVPLLLRPSKSLPDANKIRYIDRLRRLATKGAAAVLETTLARLPKDESPAVRQALTSALKSRPVVGDSK
jgi:HEAT repeat protein